MPIITASREAPSDQHWTVPLRPGGGKIFHLGKVPVKVRLGACCNVVHRDDGANWQLRAQVRFMFPK